MVYESNLFVKIVFNQTGIDKTGVTGRHLFYVRKIEYSNDVLTINQDTISERLIKIPIEWIESLLIKEEVD